MKNSKISIIISVYNKEKYVADAINSVKRQTYTNLECIVVNDGSTDNSEEKILKNIGGDKRFRYLSHENRGVAYTRNRGIENSSGEYILVLDADDYIADDYCEKAVAYLDDHKECSLYFGKAAFFNVDGKESIWDLKYRGYESLLKCNCIYVSAVFRREQYNECGGYKELASHEDWDFWIRYLYHNDNIYRTEDVVLYIRGTENGRNSNTQKKYEEILPIIYNENKSIYDEYFSFKVALCAIGKEENRYIREWVEWNKLIGFDNIILYDNNDSDGEHFEDVIGDYIESGYVIVKNYRDKKVCQVEAYNDCYNCYKNVYKWIAFFDCDEFLTLKEDNVKTFLKNGIFETYGGILINWMCYGDNGLLYDDGRKIQERFKNPVMPLNWEGVNGYPENVHFKTIVRGNLKNVIFSQPHNPYIEESALCDSDGKKHTRLRYTFENAYLKHFNTKTISEYIHKLNRGYADQIYDSKNNEKLLREVFFQYNEPTKEKIEIIRNVWNIDLSDLTKKNDKKILILCMSSNTQERFKKEEECILNSWGKRLLNEKNVKLYFYSGGYDKNRIINNRIELTSPDDWEGTWEKTRDVFKLMDEEDYDVVIRTNTTTFLNTKKMIEFINSNDYDDELVYGGRLILNSLNNYIPYMRGNILVLSKKIINKLLKIDEVFHFSGVDDCIIGQLLYIYYTYNHKSYCDNMRVLMGVNFLTKEDIAKNKKYALFFRYKTKDESFEEHNKLCTMITEKYENFDILPSKPSKPSIIETEFGTFKI